MSLALAARMSALGTETAFEVLARAKALEAKVRRLCSAAASAREAGWRL